MPCALQVPAPPAALVIHNDPQRTRIIHLPQGRTGEGGREMVGFGPRHSTACGARRLQWQRRRQPQAHALSRAMTGPFPPCLPQPSSSSAHKRTSLSGTPLRAIFLKVE